MQFSTIFTILASVAAVSAMPAVEHAPQGSGSCHAKSSVACCTGQSNSGLLGGILGGNCVLSSLLSRELMSPS
jgi:hypothetical protein